MSQIWIGVVFIKNNSKEDLVGKFVNVKIINKSEYDLIGEIM